MLWWFTQSPLLPHILIVCIDTCAWLPTFWKTLRNPASENALAWALWSVAGILSLANADVWTVSNVLYPLYIAVSDGLIVVLIIRSWMLNPKPS